MAKTESTMLSLGTKLPYFELKNTEGQRISSNQFSKTVLVMFICNHCPFVIHVQEELIALGLDYQDKLDIIAINSNDAIAYPDDGIEKMKEHQKQYSFLYLVDASQQVAKDFLAACTPDFFLFDTSKSLVYRGQLDSSRPFNNLPVDGSDLRKAIDSALENKVVEQNQKPSIGCNIKWKEGNEPSYFLN